jgi:hypothetical protein
MKGTKATVVFFILVLVTTSTISWLVVRHLPRNMTPGKTPFELGRVNHIDVYCHVGNVAFPNRYESVEGDNTRIRLSSRQRFWDAYLTTAPAPREKTTPTGTVLEVPWTLLPESITASTKAVDPQFAETLATWLKIKNSPAHWDFDRLERLEVPPGTLYGQVTGMSSIYAVNLFEFLEELGPNYPGHLKTAISSATKESIQRCGSHGERKFAIPALAAATHVLDRHLVLTYRDSFDSILDGIGRVDRGDTPSQIILVIWDASSDREMSSACDGLERACYSRIPVWSASVRLATAASLSVALFLGLLFKHLRLQRSARMRATHLIAVVSLCLIAATCGFLYLNGIGDSVNHPTVQIPIMSVAVSAIGIGVYKLGLRAAAPREGRGTRRQDTGRLVADEDTFDTIVRILHDTGVEIERHQDIYEGKDEEALRDEFVMVLSTHFGSVTGETFNKKGKTDILIRDEGKNLFVAECGIWHGAKQFSDKIDQLMSYLTWRDTDTALICFVRNKEFCSVLETIRAEAPKHPAFVKDHGIIAEAWFKYEFRHQDDPNRMVRLAVLCFHFP